ncbi:hypothetical protein Tco_0299097 [Tanacetum coccineum]
MTRSTDPISTRRQSLHPPRSAYNLAPTSFHHHIPAPPNTGCHHHNTTTDRSDTPNCYQNPHLSGKTVITPHHTTSPSSPPHTSTTLLPPLPPPPSTPPPSPHQPRHTLTIIATTPITPSQPTPPHRHSHRSHHSRLRLGLVFIEKGAVGFVIDSHIGVGVEFTSSCLGVLGDGMDIMFWEDRWVRNRILRDRFPRLARKGRLSFRVKLDRRGIDIDSVLCALCNDSVESCGDDSILSTQEYMKQVVEDVGEDEDFNSGSWVGATEYVKANGGIVSGCFGDIKTFLKNGKLEQVVAIIKSCSLNALSDLKVTIKDLSGTLAGSIYYKIVIEGCYGKEITMEEEEIVKLVEEEEMADLELHVCENVIDHEDIYKFDEEELDLVLEEEARESRAHEEWLEKCRQQEKKDAKHKRQLLGFHGTI